MATFKDVSTFRRSEVWDYFKFSWGCLLQVVRVLADCALFLNWLFNLAVLLLVTEQLLALDLSSEFIYFYYFSPFWRPPSEWRPGRPPHPPLPCYASVRRWICLNGLLYYSTLI